MSDSEKIELVKIKILIIGTLGSGKTVIANYLADAEDVITSFYRPTQGARILEFESNNLELLGEFLNAEVELWDCSGDRRFENCWPAIRNNADGAIFVCNPEESTGNDLLIWYNEFALKAQIPLKNIMVLLHHNSSERVGCEQAVADFRLPTEMADVGACIPSNIERDGAELRLEFNNFLCSIIINLRQRKNNKED